MARRLKKLYSFRRLKKPASILVVASWFLIILSIFGLGLSRMTIAEKKITAYLEDRLYADSAIDSLTKVVILSRMADADKNCDSLSELVKKEKVEFYPAKVVYSVYDEESKVNINKVPAKILEKIPGLDIDKVTAIENSKLKPFFAKEELLMIEGIKMEDYLKIKDYLTVYGNGHINMNTVSDEVLTALGFSSDFIDILNRFRAGDDEDIGTDDDGVFQSISGILDQLKKFGSVSLHDQQKFVSLNSRNMLSVYSDNYLIKSDVILRGRRRASFNIVFEKRKGKINDGKKDRGALAAGGRAEIV